jgi:hypothetical protein
MIMMLLEVEDRRLLATMYRYPSMGEGKGEIDPGWICHRHRPANSTIILPSMSPQLDRVTDT